MNHVDTTIEESICPARIVAEVAVVVMGFDIGFVNQQDAEFIAQVIPIRIVGVMCRSDGVEIELLQQMDVLSIVSRGTVFPKRSWKS